MGYKKEHCVRFFIKADKKEPTVRRVEVADDDDYWEVTIYTMDNPTFEIDQII